MPKGTSNPASCVSGEVVNRAKRQLCRLGTICQTVPELRFARLTRGSRLFGDHTHLLILSSCKKRSALGLLGQLDSLIKGTRRHEWMAL